MKYSSTLITIGDELLIGQTIDTNSAWMGQQLNNIGIPVLERIAVADTSSGIISGLERALNQSEIVLITGGLGPTKDDITKKVLADYFGMEMIFDELTFTRIEKLFERWAKVMNETHKQQCFMPNGATLLENKMGTAPGMLFEVDGKVIISMPGVPYEMQYIMESHALPYIQDIYGGQVIVHRTLMTSGEGESFIAEKIDQVVDALPPHIGLAYLPSLGCVKLRLTAKGSNAITLKQEISNYASQIEEILGDLIYGYDDQPLEVVVGQIATSKKLTIGTAESCTGGLVASKIVSIAGSSAYYQGSIVAYTNELKAKLLNVNEDTLQYNGAVSEETVTEMVKGAIEVLNCDVVVAISGVAGPTGGSEEKPVGTVWMACGNREKIIAQKIKAGKDRVKNIEYASNYALNLLRKFLKAQ